jgi:hypothetical protein
MIANDDASATAPRAEGLIWEGPFVSTCHVYFDTVILKKSALMVIILLLEWN